MGKMSLYLVSYDVVEGDSFDYEPFFASLKSMSGEKILQSAWVIPAENGSQDTIYNRIQPLVNFHDRILVIEIVGAATWDKLLIEGERFRLLLRKYSRDYQNFPS
jgi:hypothetical protein